jgi:hypothetical protein
MLALDFLRVAFAWTVLVRGEVTHVGTPIIGIIAYQLRCSQPRWLATTTMAWSQAIWKCAEPLARSGTRGRPCQAFWEFRVLVHASRIHLVLGEIFCRCQVSALELGIPHVGVLESCFYSGQRPGAERPPDRRLSDRRSISGRPGARCPPGGRPGAGRRGRRKKVSALFPFREQKIAALRLPRQGGIHRIRTDAPGP